MKPLAWAGATLLLASHLFADYLPTTEAVLWRNRKLSDIGVLRAKMDGGWMAATKDALGVVVSRTDGKLAVQFHALDGYCKAVRAELVQRGADVWARATGAGYVDAGLFGSVLADSAFNLAVATARGEGCYGVHDIDGFAVGCDETATWTTATSVGRLTVDARGGFAFEDARSGRVYRPLSRGLARADGGEVTGDGRLTLRFTDVLSRQSYVATYVLDAVASELVVTVRGEASAALAGEGLDYPAALRTEGDDRLILPVSEGLGVPAFGGGDPVYLKNRMLLYRGGDFAMPFYGAFSDATGAGWMAIVETPDDAALRVSGDGAGFRTVGPEWVASRGKFAYERKIRYVFFSRGGYVAACKRYRRYAKSKGLVKTFREKAKTRPNVERLPGAVDIWPQGNMSLEDIQVAFKSFGAERLLLNGGGTEFLDRMRDDPMTLTACYDNYRDMYRPEQLEALGRESDFNVDMWPEGAVWNSADSNDWCRAWGVKAPDGTWTYCATLCDSIAIDVMRRHVAGMFWLPLTARYIDVAAAAGWDECENPAHPMDRRQSRQARVELLRALGEEFDIVVGSEQGHDAFAAVCDYFEGMMSPADYRVPDSGRGLDDIWTNETPWEVTQVQVNEKVRLPLWELVYHDCVCAHWYGGDYSNKIPAVWDRRDLLNALYATPPFFRLVKGQWPEEKARFEQTCRLVVPIARDCGFSEMTDHQILSADRSVQRTSFANGISVTVNFGPEPWRDSADGAVVEPGTVRVWRPEMAYDFANVYEPFLTKADKLIWQNRDLSDIVSLTGVNDGGWLDPTHADAYVCARTADSLVAQFQADDGLCKTVRAVFTQVGADIYGRADAAGYDSSGRKHSELPNEKFVQPLATSPSEPGYGTFHLEAFGDVVGEIDGLPTGEGPITLDGGLVQANVWGDADCPNDLTGSGGLLLKAGTDFRAREVKYDRYLGPYGMTLIGQASLADIEITGGVLNGGWCGRQPCLKPYNAVYDPATQTVTLQMQGAYRASWGETRKAIGVRLSQAGPNVVVRALWARQAAGDQPLGSDAFHWTGSTAYIPIAQSATGEGYGVESLTLKVRERIPTVTLSGKKTLGAGLVVDGVRAILANFNLPSWSRLVVRHGGTLEVASCDEFDRHNRSYLIEDGSRLVAAGWNACYQETVVLDASEMEVRHTSNYVRDLTMRNESRVTGAQMRVGLYDNTVWTAEGDRENVVFPELNLLGNGKIVFTVNALGNVAFLGGVVDSVDGNVPYLNFRKTGPGTLRLGGKAWKTDSRVTFEVDGGRLAVEVPVTAGPLVVGGASEIALGTGGQVVFADSSAQAWSLNEGEFLNFTGVSSRRIRFGANGEALTATQLGHVRIDGEPVRLDAAGWLRLAERGSCLFVR